MNGKEEGDFAMNEEALKLVRGGIPKGARFSQLLEALGKAYAQNKATKMEQLVTAAYIMALALRAVPSIFRKDMTERSINALRQAVLQ